VGGASLLGFGDFVPCFSRLALRVHFTFRHFFWVGQGLIDVALQNHRLKGGGGVLDVFCEGGYEVDFKALCGAGKTAGVEVRRGSGVAGDLAPVLAAGQRGCEVSGVIDCEVVLDEAGRGGGILALWDA